MCLVIYYDTMTGLVVDLISKNGIVQVTNFLGCDALSLVTDVSKKRSTFTLNGQTVHDI